MEVNELRSDVNTVRTKAKEMLDTLEIKGLFFLLSSPSQDVYEEYLKRMILSFFDMKIVIDKTKMHREEYFRIKAELLYFGELGEQTLQKILKSRSEKKALTQLAYGALSPFANLSNTSLTLLSDCLEIQSQFGLCLGIVGPYDQTSLTLPNGEKLVSPDPDSIANIFQIFQKQYEIACMQDDQAYFMKAVEIISSLLINQIFREGNKRTTKSLFNQMLLSRGIIPPIADLNENLCELIDEIILSRNNHFEYVYYKLLLQTYNVRYQLNQGFFKEVYRLEIDEKVRKKRYLIR